MRFGFGALPVAIQSFLRFAAVSGVGWLLDVFSFLLLVYVAEASPFQANFVSSFVGITYVWFVSLRKVFDKTQSAWNVLLVVYWGYQVMSITLYSQILAQVSAQLWSVLRFTPLTELAEACAKILITPLNLMTNFVFMRILTRFLR